MVESSTVVLFGLVERNPGPANPDQAEVNSVWLRPRRPRRTAPTLSRERITEGAVDLLDQTGIEQLTMRRLAQHLEVGAPTLYWHVATKDDVIDLAVDAIFAERALPDATGSWRADIADLLARWREVMLEHPWSAALPARQRPLLGPAFLAWMEFLQASLVRAGFDRQALHAATWALYNHVVGAASAQASLQLSDAERRLGQDQLHRRSASFPTLAAHGYLLDDRWDEDFTVGLSYLLDGLSQSLHS